MNFLKHHAGKSCGKFMSKIVIVGAGSHVFSRRLIVDLLSYPELRKSTISLVDIDKERLDLISSFAKNLVKQHDF